MVLLIGVAAFAAAFPVLAVGASRARAAHDSHRAAIQFLGDGGFGRVAQRAAAGPLQRHLAAIGARLTPHGYAEAVAGRIRRSGAHRSVEQVLAAKAAGGIAGLLFGLVNASAKPGAGLFVLAVCAPLGFFAPDALLRRRAERRADAIRRSLPDALDLMAILVEAGVGLEAAVARAADDADGPLAEELTRVLHEMSLGSSRREAFAALRDRVECAELSGFVLALLQADRLGVAVGKVLRSQAGEMRTKRRLRAKEKAAKTPVKILFPLVFGIFPALLAVILGPAVIRIMQTTF
ncbi:MAG TPA: type II secretion system F family protein [Actinomycetota bacterium]